MLPTPPPFAAAARRLARALIGITNSARLWTPAHEQTLRTHLVSSPLNPSFLAAVIDPHLLRHGSLAAGLFHCASLLPGFSPSPLLFHSLIKALSFSRHPHPLIPLLRLAVARRVPLLPASYHLAISILLNSKQVFEALNLVNCVDDELPGDLYNSLLSKVTSIGSFEIAHKVFDKMIQRKVGFTDLGAGVFLRRTCQDLDLNEVLAFVEEVRRGSNGINGSVLAVLIVDGLCRAGKIEEAWRALEELRKREWKPDFVAYRVVSEEFMLVGRVEEAGVILKQKRKFGVAPRAKEYGNFILLLIAERQIQEAKELGLAIVSGDFPIEDDVLNALVGSVSAVDPDSAILFCKYMIEKARFPSIALLGNLGRNLCRNQKNNEMLDIFRNLSAKGYFDDMERYNVMLSFLCKAGRVREAYVVLKEMKRKGFGPDVQSYNILMEGLCREDLMRPAKKLWDEMFANGCCPNLLTYSILIQKFSQMGEVEEAKHLYHNMWEKGVGPDNLIVGSLMKTLCQENQFNAAIEIFKKLIEQDISLAGSVLSILVTSLCKEGNFTAALGVLHGFPLMENSDSHVIFLKNLADAGEVKMAIDHLKWVRNNSAYKLQKIFTELAASLSTAPKLDPILHLLQEMYVQGLITDGVALTNLLEGGLL